MKRSIICFIIFAVVVIGFSCAEIIYANSLAKYVDETIKKCSDTADTQEKYTFASELEQKFNRLESINELFLTKKTIEKFVLEISDLVVYCQSGNEESIERSLKRIKLYTEHLYNAGIF